jgi:hypothetical protein
MKRTKEELRNKLKDQRKMIIALSIISCWLFIWLIWSLAYPSTPSDTGVMPENDFIDSNAIIYDYQECYVSYYEIEYVDALNNDNCYAMVQKEEPSYIKSSIRASFLHAGETPQQMFGAKKCRHYITSGKLWCLKDNSTCLQLRDNNKICNIISLGEQQ